MKEDKTLTCCECGAEFVFTASEQEFYEKKVSPTNRVVAPLAVKLANNVWALLPNVRNAKCSPQPALNVVKKPWYRSVLLWIVRYTAVNASTLVKVNKYINAKA